MVQCREEDLLLVLGATFHCDAVEQVAPLLPSMSTNLLKARLVNFLFQIVAGVLRAYISQANLHLYRPLLSKVEPRPGVQCRGFALSFMERCVSQVAKLLKRLSNVAAIYRVYRV